MTVGSGIGPDLLTPDGKAGALAGSCLRTYRRWGIAPRPEDVCVPANRRGHCSSPLCGAGTDPAAHRSVV